MPTRAAALECYEPTLMGDFVLSPENYNTNSSASRKEQAKEVSVGKKDSAGSWAL